MLSVVIPIYNEAATLAAVVGRVRAVGVPTQVILVDDCSTDGSAEVIAELAKQHEDLVCLHHKANRGKGAAVRTGIAAATEDMVIVQDADLEYDPADFPKLIEPILDGRADVVFGSRFAGGETHRVLYYWHSVANRSLTTLSNMLTNLNLTDMEVGYKVFRREVIQGIALREDRFGFEPEVTAKVARLGLRIYEVGVSYSGRTYAEGKKITMRDGVRALWCIVKYNTWARGPKTQAPAA